MCIYAIGVIITFVAKKNFNRFYYHVWMSAHTPIAPPFPSPQKNPFIITLSHHGPFFIGSNTFLAIGSAITYENVLFHFQSFIFTLSSFI